MTVNRANEVAKEIVDTAEDCPHCFGEDVVHDQSKRNHRELWLSEECLVERIATAIQSEVDAAVRAEAEACAKVADWCNSQGLGADAAKRQIAHTIRERWDIRLSKLEKESK